jgi:hypothetical protein
MILFEIMGVQRTDADTPRDVALGLVCAQRVSKSLDYRSKRFSSSLRHPAQMHFARTGVVLLEAFVDREGVGELVTRWNASHPGQQSIVNSQHSTLDSQ